MKITDQIQADIVTAMKAKDASALSTLRGLKTAISQAALLKGNINTEVDEQEILQVIRKQIAQRQESATMFRQGGKDDAAAKEDAEAAILSAYLPAALSDHELEAIVDQAIAQTSATTVKDMGKAMKFASELAAGRADGKTLSAAIKSRLSA
jgi:uncharacterized protein YqeY